MEKCYILDKGYPISAYRVGEVKIKNVGYIKERVITYYLIDDIETPLYIADTEAKNAPFKGFMTPDSINDYLTYLKGQKRANLASGAGISDNIYDTKIKLIKSIMMVLNNKEGLNGKFKID